MSKNAKLWTAGTLKSRGWTEELIASLLPKPQRLYRNGRRVRAWHTDDIRRAEQSESFRSLRAAAAADAESVTDGAALAAAAVNRRGRRDIAQDYLEKLARRILLYDMPGIAD